MIYDIMHNAPPKRSFMHVNNGSNSHQELKDFVYIVHDDPNLKEYKSRLHHITLRNSPMQSMSLWRYTVELNFEGGFCRWPIFCLWGHFVVGSQNTGCCKQPLGEGGVGL